MQNKRMITILGPTASGKTAVAAALALRTDGEIISADSRQVYRRMDIGTGKDLADYVVDGQPIPYHLIDIAEPGTKYNLFQYQHDFHEAYDDICSRGKLPILCGGTGLYIEAVLGGYQLSPRAAESAVARRSRRKSLAELTEMLVELKRRNGRTCTIRPTWTLPSVPYAPSRYRHTTWKTLHPNGSCRQLTRSSWA